MATREEIVDMGYKLDIDSCHYNLKGAHRNDVFPWRISKKMVCEMDERDFSALKDLVRMVTRA